MGFLDKAKQAAQKAVDKGGDKVGDAIDKGTDFVDTKSKGKHTDKLDSAGERVKDALDGLDGKNDDIPDGRQSTRPKPKP